MVGDDVMKKNFNIKQLLIGICLILILVTVCIVGREKIEFQLMLNRAFYYSEKGDYEAEIRGYDKLIKQEPEIYELYVNKAIALANNNNIYDALSTFQEAELLNNNDPELYYNMAHLYEIIKDDEMYQFYMQKGTALEFQQNVREK